MPDVNCFTLEHAGIEPFIHVPRGYARHLSLGYPLWEEVVPFGAPGLEFPTLGSHGIVSAAPHKSKDGKPRLVARGSWRGALLRVATAKLAFPRNYKLTGKRLLLGGHGVEPFAQAGGDHARHKDQLFVLEDGNTLWVVDIHGAVAAVECSKGEFFMRQATEEEVRKHCPHRHEPAACEGYRACA